MAAPAVDLSTLAGGLDSDPFSGTPVSKAHLSRSPAFDGGDLPSSSFLDGSPSQARRTLEARIKDTDQRIQDASHLGTTLLEQKKQLAARLRDVEQYQNETEVGPELKQKLLDLEKEYIEVGQESTRSFLPKNRKTSAENGETNSYSADGRSSPSKLQVPTRKSRNQPASRVQDIEFATEISSSLLSQVRQLNAALAEKDEALKRANGENARLQLDTEASHQRLRSLDDNEQRYKDENWHLETQVQDLSVQLKDATAREQRLNQNLASSKTEKSAADREYEELKQAHTQLTDDHSTLKRQHDADIAGLRRNVSAAATERDNLSKKVEELTSQNEELARAVAFRVRTENLEQTQKGDLDDESASAEHTTPEPSPPPSPNKGTPRHGGLESETLKSSLHHAHRMIQNLKNNIHREKTEKIELRRMLQDARDELETRRSDPSAIGSAVARRRKLDEKQGVFKKPSLHKLGGVKSPKEEIINDPSWEDYTESPERLTKQRLSHISDGRATDTGSDNLESANERDTSDGAFETATDREASDAGFETADEQRSTTENEGFQTGAESMAGDSSDELTETESSHPKRTKGTPTTRPRADHRNSYLSTASDDWNSYDALDTPPRSNSQRFKLTPGRGFHKSEDTPSAQGSPASFISNGSQPRNRQSLAAELEDLGDDNSSLAQSTPSRTITSLQSSPRDGRDIASPALSSFSRRATMVDASTLTEPWKPHTEDSIVDTSTVAGAVAGATVGGVLSRLVSVVRRDNAPLPTASETPDVQKENTKPNQDLDIGSNLPAVDRHVMDSERPSTSHKTVEPGKMQKLQISSIQSQHTEPIASRPLPPNVERERPSTSIFAPLVIPPSPSSIKTGSPKTHPATPSKSSYVAPAPADGAGNPTRRTLGSVNVLPDVETTSENDAMLKNLSAVPNQKEQRKPFEPVSGNIGPTAAMKSEGTQTSMSAQDIAHVSKPNLPLTALAIPDPFTPTKPSVLAASRAPEGMGSLDQGSPRSQKRPGSAGSYKTSPAVAASPSDLPPLPADHKQLIAAASRNSSSVGLNAPSNSPFKAQSQLRPLTPGHGNAETASIVYAHSPQNRPTSATARSEATRRTSISSFASEVEHRIEGSGEGFVMSNLDPRMIQAITQTMIGEYLWKYTRKAGRGTHSQNRHKRFFWIHPYTRTLYWSDKDPSRAGKKELNAKSVAISAVRVVADDNPMPPGLHRKSILIVTPGRIIKFTAPTSGRHETWFNALSYLLLRNGQRQDNPNGQHQHSLSDSVNNRPGTVESDTSEYVPTLHQRSASRLASTSHRSLASSSVPGRNASISNTISLDPRTSSGHGRLSQMSSMGSRAAFSASPRRPTDSYSNADRTSRISGFDNASQPPPSRGTDYIPEDPAEFMDMDGVEVDADGFKIPPKPVAPSRRSSKSGRKGSLSSKLRPASLFASQRSHEKQDSDGGALDGAEHGSSFDGESTGRDSLAMENVRACCDGKHDVGSISHRVTHRLSTSSRH